MYIMCVILCLFSTFFFEPQGRRFRNVPYYYYCYYYYYLLGTLWRPFAQWLKAVRFDEAFASVASSIVAYVIPIFGLAGRLSGTPSLS